MTSSLEVEDIEMNTCLPEPFEQNTASLSAYGYTRSRQTTLKGTGQYYALRLRGNPETNSELPGFSRALVDLVLAHDLGHLEGYFRTTLLGILESKGGSEPLLFGSSSAPALEEFHHIFSIEGKPACGQPQEESGFSVGPPDDYIVEGISIDWKSAFKHHRNLNKLREKHGIRQV
jgi:hypothetical protein